MKKQKFFNTMRRLTMLTASGMLILQAGSCIALDDQTVGRFIEGVGLSLLTSLISGVTVF